ncbi:MMPL family transporter [Dactylosporangium sp. NPDC051541]|uniref:MMPL family transporter n=1 Tax=Dactylosporangium sp. NPDC051541 TaxID=3363977 RepID=UPI00379CEB62
MNRYHPIVGLVCGRWTKWVVLAAWIAIFLILSPLAGKLEQVQKDDASTWLPGSAESTKVVNIQTKTHPVTTAPAVIIYERAGGITQADQDRAAKAAADIATLPDTVGKVIGPIPSKDGKGVQLIVTMVFDSDHLDKVQDDVNSLRTTAGTSGDGLTVYVTGPSAMAADSLKAFSGIDTTLLYTTLAVIVVILLLTYRSPILWILPVFSAGLSLISSQAVVYLIAKNSGLLVNGQSIGILTVLVFGAATDYALLLLARYREELHNHKDRHEAMKWALHRAAPAIIASAATVAIGTLCLLAAQMNSTKGLGPIAAIGIGVGLITMMTLLPALLVIFGRWMFWPARPKYEATHLEHTGVWRKIGEAIDKRRRIVWIITALVLGGFAFGLVTLKADGLKQADSFVTKPDSVIGAEVAARHFPAGSTEPVWVVGSPDKTAELRTALAGTEGIADVSDPETTGGYVFLQGTLQDAPDSEAAAATIDRVRDRVHAVAGANGLVGGSTATDLDTARASRADRNLIIPLILVVVLLILGLLLRAVVAPLVLMATVVLSFGTALGISALLFKAFGFHGAETDFPLLVFVFLVALGIDYNIFLMTRVREESVRHGSRRGALIGLAATGGVITSAGLVLAGTFSALATLPVVSLAEIGVTVAVGVLLDTLIVRSILVTALSLDLGRHMWWPSKLSRPESDHPAPPLDEAPDNPADEAGNPADEAAPQPEEDESRTGA